MKAEELNTKSDIELIALAQKNESQAYDLLFARYKAFICKIARSYFITGIGDSDDLIQEGTIGFCKAVAEYRPEKNNSFPAYASLCVHNRIKDVLRGYMRKAESVASPVSINDATTNEERISLSLVCLDDPVTSYIRDESMDDLMKKAKAHLSPRQFTAFELYLSGFGYQEIANRMGLDPKSADNALTAAKTKLKKLYVAEENK